MKVVQVAPFAATAIIGLAVLAWGCNGQTASPDSLTAPGAFQTAPTCGSPSHTISGVITASQGGPLADVGIEVAPYPHGYSTSAKTDTTGRYSVCEPQASMVGLQVYRSGYATAFKYGLPAIDQTINLALRPRFEVPVSGGTINAVIRGDEFEGGDDYFGGMCVGRACKIVDFNYDSCPCPNRRSEITLRWADPSSHLALYFSNADTYFPPALVPPATRYCCSAPATATYTFNADFDRFAIGFEQIAGGRPGPGDSQSFELTIRPVP